MDSAKQYPFPDEFLPPEQKETDEYGCQTGRAVYDMLIRGYTYPGYGNRWWNGIMSLYAQGRQPAEQYIASYLGYGTFVNRSSPNQDFSASGSSDGGAARNAGVNPEFARKGLQNINFQNVPIAPKHLSTIKSVLNEADYMVDVQSNSKDAIQKKVLEKWKMYVSQKIMNPLREMNGISPIKYDWYPQNKQELEIYEKYHGFKLPFETGLLKILKHSFAISHWDDIFEKFKETALETSWMCGRVYCNNQGAVVIEQIDPSDYITAYFDKQEMDESPFGGHKKQVQLVNIVPELIAKGATPEQIQSIASRNAGINQIGDVSQYDFSYRDPATSRYLWYDWYVDVMHFEVRSNDEEKYRQYSKKNGKGYAKENPQVVTDEAGKSRFSYNPKNNKNTEHTDIYRNQQIYEGDWIIGTEWIMNYKRQKNVLKNSDGSCALSYFHYHVPGMPIVERWQPEIDQFQMAWLKLQAAVLASAPDGFIIDMGLFSNMNFGYGNMDGPMVAKIRKEIGNFYVRSTEFMLKNRISPSQAMIPIKGGPGEQVQSWMALMEYYEGIIRKVSGITPSMEGASDQKPELVGLMQGEMIATGNALYTYKRGLISLKEKMARKIVAKARMLIEFNPMSKEYYSGVIGDEYIRDILLYKDLTLNQIGITLRAAPTELRKNQIREYVKIALTPGKSGQSQIDLDDAMFIEDSINEGYLELAIWYLSIAKQRKSQAQAAQAKAEQQQNAQVQIQSAQAAEKAKMETQALLSKMETDADMRKEAQKGQIESALEREKHLYKMAELTLEGELEARNKVSISGEL